MRNGKHPPWARMSWTTSFLNQKEHSVRASEAGQSACINFSQHLNAVCF